MSQLNVEQLSVQFELIDRYLPATTDISIELKPGETIALLGESGCGKSITATAIMRLLPRNACFGHTSRIWLDDEDLLVLAERKMRQVRGKRVAMISRNL